ncbi:hypothetical protein ACQCVH_10260 [Bacillus infantis]
MRLVFFGERHAIGAVPDAVESRLYSCRSLLFGPAFCWFLPNMGDDLD